MVMASPISINDEKRSVLRRSSRHQTRELKPESRENGCDKASVLRSSWHQTRELKAERTGNGCDKASVLRSSRHQTRELIPESTENGCDKARFAGPESVDSKCVNILAACEENVLTISGTIDMNHEVETVAGKLASKRKNVSPKTNDGRYPLWSSSGGGRVLRSMSKSNCTTEPEPANNPVDSVIKGKRKGRKVKRHLNDEFAATKKRVRYLLTRMNYEQSLIDAYSGEGWKGQSAEKIRPQKELERAKSEILRCKFKIRELFRHLDSLSSEGRFDDSLFDSEGRIDSEDIFCAKCGSKDFSSDNDIILCDGMCNRGFHQQCLNPPLLSEDIPPGDEGWLCPACECKIDCVKLLNEFRGSNILVKDTWKKVFPEVVTIANGDKQYEDSPSDDSEDCDYHPDRPKVDVEGHKEESDFEASDSHKKSENFGLPSDDSEDDDFDPDSPYLDKDVQKDGSSSDESDFTSDSDEFCYELGKTLGSNEDTAASLPNLKPIAEYGDDRHEGDINKSEFLSILEPGLNQENVPMSGKRQTGRLDYKKLYDETYEKSSSDSSDDEDWSASARMSTPNKRKKHINRKTYSASSKANLQTAENHGCQESHSNIAKSASVSKRLGEITTQKLYESFQENQYPTREKKESLAQELGLAYQKVDKWFINSRHQIRVSSETQPNIISTPIKDSGDTNTETTMIQSAKRRKSVANRKLYIGAEYGKNDSGRMNEIDEDRQKAIARELRKLKQCR